MNTPPNPPLPRPDIWTSADPLTRAVWIVMVCRADPLMNGVVLLSRFEIAALASHEDGPRYTEADVGRALEELQARGRVEHASGAEHRALGYWRVIFSKEYQARRA